MEIAKVVYSAFDGITRAEHTKSFSVVEGGLVLIFSELSQYFIPWHRVIGIEQTFSNSVETHERVNKSLVQRMRIRENIVNEMSIYNPPSDLADKTAP